MDDREFLLTSDFKREIAALNANAQFEEIVTLLKQHPDYGKIVPGSGGLRKIRMGLPGRGKRGGARVIYYDIISTRTILLLTVYAKNEQTGLGPRQLSRLMRVRDELVLKIRRLNDEKNF